MKYRSGLMVFMMLFFCSSLVFGAGSFFESANQAEEAGKAVKPQDAPPVDDASLAGEEEEPGNSKIDKDREKDSPADHDNGKGNDDKVANDNSPADKDRQKDSPADHDNGKGNDDKVASDDSRADKDRQKDSPADHDNGKGNDDKAAKDKKVVDPSKPCDNDEFDPSGKGNPGTIGGCSDKELISIIDKTWNIKVTGWQSRLDLMNHGFSWSHSHLFEIYRTLYVLPRMFFVGNLNLCWSKCMPSCSSICHLQGSSIFFCNYAPMREGWLSVLFIREMARHLFLSKEFAYLRAQWIKMFWLDERVIKIQPPFKFVCKTPDEDFGESVKSYWCCGDWFHSRDQARYEFVHRLVMKGKKFSWGNGGCGCDESDADVGAEPKKPVATATKQIGNGDHGASGKIDLNDKNKIDNASKANNTPKQTTPAVKTTTTVTKTTTVTVKTTATTTVKQPVQPVKPAVAPVVKPVAPAPAKPPAQPAKPVAAPSKTPATGNGDHGASGKADLNDKNKVDNASKANNAATQAAKPAAAPAAKPIVTTPVKQTAQPANVSTKTPASGNGDHGASGKADLNDKNKVDNASKANNAATQAAKPAAASSKTSNASQGSSAAAPTKTSSSGNGDHGASGKADLNDKNKTNNAATANNSAAKATGSTKK